MNDRNEDYDSAKKRAEEKLGFYSHAAAFVVVNAVLTAIDLTTSPDSMWFFWPLAGWGAGLLMHGLRVFGNGTSSLKEKMIERELKHQN